jgi:PTH1 family peptidyl-tRNA hydrolase
MNLSGESVSRIVGFYKIDPTVDMLVLVDDLDMEFAKVRYRTRGTAGGQNGIKSLIGQLGTEEFSRIKIGIGRDERYDVSDWVLSQFQKDELNILEEEVFPIVQTKIDDWIKTKQ